MVVTDNLHEHWHGEVEVLSRRIAPAAVVIGLCIVWWAEVGGSYCDNSRCTVCTLDASELVAGTAGEAVVEENCA